MVTRLTVDGVYQHIRGVCFKTGPPGTVGAETEWFVVDAADTAAHVPAGRVRALVEDAGPRPPEARSPTSRAGSWSSAPRRSAGSARCTPRSAATSRTCGPPSPRTGWRSPGTASTPSGAPVPGRPSRYACMRDYFRAGGFPDAGLAMMCSTASVQVNLDIGADDPDASRRWRLTHALGPVLVAAFANSPLRAGRRTGMRSSRQGIWTELDPCRTLPVLRDGADGDPAEAWTRYALDARVMLVHTAEGEWVSDPGMSFLEWLDKGEPCEDDLTYHLSTLFPPVRPRGWRRLRMIDAPPGRYWPVPVAVATALLDDPAACRAAEAAAEPVADRWAEAARCGLADAPLAAAARTCFTAALDALPRLGASGLVPLVEEYARRYVEQGRSPADDDAPTPLSEEDEIWP